MVKNKTIGWSLITISWCFLPLFPSFPSASGEARGKFLESKIFKGEKKEDLLKEIMTRGN